MTIVEEQWGPSGRSCLSFFAVQCDWPTPTPRALKVVEMTQPTWEHLNQRFSALLAAPLTAQTAPQYLEEWKQLNRAIYQARGELIRAYYAHSTDAQAKENHDQFVRDHFPRLNAASTQFIQRLAASGVDYPATWQQFVAHTPSGAPSEELLALFGEENQLGKSFQQIRASTVYRVDGEEVQPGQLAAKLQHPDREERRKAYLGLIGSEHQKDDELNELFVKLHGIRTRISHLCGFRNYYEYAVNRGPLHNKAYTSSEVFAFREAIKKHIVPLFLELRRIRKSSLGVQELRPWDNMLNPFGITPMAQFSDDEDVLNRTQQVLNRLDPELGTLFGNLRSEQLIDIESRPDKARNGYSSILPETEQPFVIMHIGPRAFNIHLLFHELGHALHYAMMPKDQPYEVYATPLEFAEFISQTFEIITVPFLREFFNEKELEIVDYLLLERVCFDIINTSKLDEFQERVYKEEAVDSNLVSKIYDEVDASYPTGVEWGEMAYIRPYFWKNLTLFSSPFYRFEYGVAWVAALKFQGMYQEDPQRSLNRFKDSMRLGFTRSPRELFQTAGIHLDFGEKTLAQTAQELRRRMLIR